MGEHLGASKFGCYDDHFACFIQGIALVGKAENAGTGAPGPPGSLGGGGGSGAAAPGASTGGGGGRHSMFRKRSSNGRRGRINDTGRITTGRLIRGSWI